MSCKPDFVQMAGKRIEKLKNCPLPISTTFVTGFKECNHPHTTNPKLSKRPPLHENPTVRKTCAEDSSPQSVSPTRNLPRRPEGTPASNSSPTCRIYLFLRSLSFPNLPITSTLGITLSPSSVCVLGKEFLQFSLFCRLLHSFCFEFSARGSSLPSAG